MKPLSAPATAGAMSGPMTTPPRVHEVLARDRAERARVLRLARHRAAEVAQLAEQERRARLHAGRERGERVVVAPRRGSCRRP